MNKILTEKEKLENENKKLKRLIKKLEKENLCLKHQKEEIRQKTQEIPHSIKCQQCQHTSDLKVGDAYNTM